jgi:UDP-glucose:(heptosyl)LPS alpha-1,3-glucosyltransferase
MRLGIIRFAYSPFGGAEKSIERIVQALKKSYKRPIEITLFSASWSCNSDHYKVVQIPIRSTHRISRVKEFSKKVRQAFRSESLDIIQSHERISGCDIFRAGDGCHAAWLDRHYGSKGIRHWFSMLDPFHRKVLSEERKIAEDPKTLIISNSSLIKTEFIERYKTDPNRIIVIPNAIDTQEFQPVSEQEKSRSKKTLGIPADVPVVLFMGSDYERKGAHLLIEAVRALSDIHVIIVGKDNRIQKLNKLIARHGLTKRVLMLGPQPDVKPFLSSADIFCLPSLYDSSPNAALEALSYDLPCIVCEGVGISNSIREADAGIVCERQVDAIAHALSLILRNLTNYRNKPRQLALSFDEARIAPLWQATYESQMKRRPDCA